MKNERDRPVDTEENTKIIITEDMLKAGEAAFSNWVSSDEDEGVVQESPSPESVRSLLSNIFCSMVSA